MASGGDEQRRQRIMKHLNQSHKLELAHCLQHLSSLPAPIATADSPEVRDVNLERMLIRAGDRCDYSVPFLPPLSSWDEIRPRVIEMDATATAALGLDKDVVITEYTPPEGFGICVFSGVVFFFACYASLPWVVPGSTSWNVLSAVFPGGPAWFHTIVKTIFWPVVIIHSCEAIGFDRTRMMRHGVPRWSRLWWLWVSNCWVEGFTAWKRIDAMVAAKRANKRLKKQ